MRLRTFAPAVVVFALTVVAWPAAAPRYMSVDEVRPGMFGVGRTVFEGDRIEEFKVQLLGVLRNTNGPRRNMVLARLEGGPLAATGVIAGMSGSPVYVDGRLLGAVAFSVGQFAKEPIAGITPIEEMIESASPQPRRAPLDRVARLDLPLTQEKAAAALREAFARFRQPFADSPDDVRLAGFGLVEEPRAAQLGALMRPIATPLTLGGFSGSVRDTVSAVLQNSGFVPMPDARPSPPSSRGGTPPPPADAPLLRPGDPVGVNLITGDFVLGATGTVTEVDGIQVYAFGHSFYNLGTTQFPMTRAFVLAVLPSLTSSLKIVTTGETIGTFRQDRSTAIAGTLGKGPDLVPVRVSLDTERGLRKTFSFGVVDDQLFTPLLTYVAILNTLSSYEREFGTATFTVRGSAKVRAHGEVAFDDVFAGESPSAGAANAIVAPITALLGNDVERADLEAVELHITTSERPQTSTLERVWVDAVKVRPGTTVPLKVLTRTYRGDEVIRTISVEIPANASGSLSILVSDGGKLALMEQRDLRSAQPKSLDQMVRLLNKTRRGNRLYIRLLRQDAGAIVNGETMAGLPPSVLAVMESDRNGGGVSPLRNATAGEWEVATDGAVTGSRILTITIQSN
jgi:hypothetical protein